MSSTGWGTSDVSDESADGGVEYLTLRDLLALAKALNVGPVRDLGLLDSAAHRPRSSFAGQLCLAWQPPDKDFPMEQAKRQQRDEGQN